MNEELPLAHIKTQIFQNTLPKEPAEAWIESDTPIQHGTLPANVIQSDAQQLPFQHVPQQLSKPASPAAISSIPMTSNPPDVMSLAASSVPAIKESPRPEWLNTVLDESPTGKIIIFFSGHGGCGASMIATNFAAFLATLNQKTCIVDLDLQLGDVLTILGVKSRYQLSSIIADLDHQEWEMISPLLDRHASGLCIMSQVGNIESLNVVESSRIPILLQHLQRHFQYVIVDGPRDFSDHSLAAIDVADNIMLIGTPTVVNLRGTGLRLEILQQLGFNLDRIKLVINRYQYRGTIQPQHIYQSIGINPSFLLPNDFAVVNHAMNEGLMLYSANPEAKITLAIKNMVSQVCGIRLAQPVKKGLLDRLFRRKK